MGPGPRGLSWSLCGVALALQLAGPLEEAGSDGDPEKQEEGVLPGGLRAVVAVAASLQQFRQLRVS